MSEEACKKFFELREAMATAYGELFRAQVDEELMLELAARGIRKSDLQTAYDAVRKIGEAALAIPEPV